MLKCQGSLLCFYLLELLKVVWTIIIIKIICYSIAKKKCMLSIVVSWFTMVGKSRARITLSKWDLPNLFMKSILMLVVFSSLSYTETFGQRR